jgi:hypothetical protein
MSDTELVHWQTDGGGASGHAHRKCISAEHHEVEVDPAGEWTRCIGKPGICDWCGKEGTVVK